MSATGSITVQAVWRIRLWAAIVIIGLFLAIQFIGPRDASAATPTISCGTYPFALDDPAMGWGSAESHASCRSWKGWGKAAYIQNCGICTVPSVDPTVPVKGYRWTGTRWAERSIPQGTWIYSWPYAGDTSGRWSWGYTVADGWLAVRSTNILVCSWSRTTKKCHRLY